MSPAAVNWLLKLRRQNAGLFSFDARKEPPAGLLAGRSSRKVNLIRATEAHLQALAAFPNLQELTLYEPRARSLASLGRLKRLRTLAIEDPLSLAGLERAGTITTLSLSHFTKIARLDPLAGLSGLRTLSLATITSWDSSRRCLVVQSLAPLARLKSLRSLTLMGVKPRDGRLDHLAALSGLKELQISHVFNFTMRDYTALAAALPRTRGTCLEPHWIHPPLADILRCKKCRASKVYLTAPGPRKRQMLCPVCDAVALQKHDAAWAALLKQPPVRRNPK